MGAVSTSKTWGGRFTGNTDARVEAFTESISFDSRLAAFDVEASQAHARMLAQVGLLTRQEAEDIQQALNAILEDIDAGRMEFTPKLEDIHTHIEQAL
nr:lyase family protein [Gemmatales bacterium]